MPVDALARRLTHKDNIYENLAELAKDFSHGEFLEVHMNDFTFNSGYFAGFCPKYPTSILLSNIRGVSRISPASINRIDYKIRVVE